MFQEMEATDVMQCINQRPFLQQRFCRTVPDINLECDESVDDWDDFDNGNRSLYSPENNEKLATIFEDSPLVSCENRPPPNSPVMNLNKPNFLQNQYVESLLQLWHESENVWPANETDEYSQSSTESFSLPSASSTSSSTDDREISSDESNAGSISPVHINDTRPDIGDLLSAEGVSFRRGLGLFPASHSSSRSTSPAEIEAISQSVLGLSFNNFRAISPNIGRSPSPISLRSSSPRFLRSPSPFQVLDMSSQNILMDTATENMMLYDDHYIQRSYSPVLVNIDHQVPDVDMEFQEAVMQYEEFPAFSTYRRQRFLNSCTDQVVPEYIEE